MFVSNTNSTPIQHGPQGHPLSLRELHNVSLSAQSVSTTSHSPEEKLKNIYRLRDGGYEEFALKECRELLADAHLPIEIRSLTLVAYNGLNEHLQTRTIAQSQRMQPPAATYCPKAFTERINLAFDYRLQGRFNEVHNLIEGLLEKNLHPTQKEALSIFIEETELVEVGLEGLRRFMFAGHYAEVIEFCNKFPPHLQTLISLQRIKVEAQTALNRQIAPPIPDPLQRELNYIAHLSQEGRLGSALQRCSHLLGSNLQENARSQIKAVKADIEWKIYHEKTLHQVIQQPAVQLPTLSEEYFDLDLRVAAGFREVGRFSHALDTYKNLLDRNLTAVQREVATRLFRETLGQAIYSLNSELVVGDFKSVVNKFKEYKSDFSEQLTEIGLAAKTALDNLQYAKSCLKRRRKNYTEALTSANKILERSPFCTEALQIKNQCELYMRGEQNAKQH